MSWSGSWGSASWLSPAGYLGSLYPSQKKEASGSLSDLDLTEFGKIPIDFSRSSSAGDSSSSYIAKKSEGKEGKFQIIEIKKPPVDQKIAANQWNTQFTSPTYHSRDNFTYLIYNFLPSHLFSEAIGNGWATHDFAIKNRGLIRNPKAINTLPVLPCHLITQEKCSSIGLAGLILQPIPNAIPSTYSSFSTEKFYSAQPEENEYFQHTVKGLLNKTDGNSYNIVRFLPEQVKIVGIWVKTFPDGRPLISPGSYEHLKYLAKFLSPNDTAPDPMYFRHCECKCHQAFLDKVKKINLKYDGVEKFERIRQARKKSDDSCSSCMVSEIHQEYLEGKHIPPSAGELPIVKIPVPLENIFEIGPPERITEPFENYVLPYDGFRLKIGDLTYEIKGKESYVLKNGERIKKIDREFCHLMRLIHAYLPEEERVDELYYPELSDAFKPGDETIIELFRVTASN
jgi:hypothetical protein